MLPNIRGINPRGCEAPRYSPAMRRDEIEWVRQILAGAAEHLAGRGDPDLPLSNARGKVIWVTREYMPTGARNQSRRPRSAVPIGSGCWRHRSVSAAAVE